MLDGNKNKYLTSALILATPLLIYYGRQLYLKFYRKSYVLYRTHKREIKNTVYNMDNENNKSIIRMSVGEESIIESLNNKLHDMKLRLLYKLDRKNFETTQQKSNKDPFLPPFQDGIFIADLSSSHRLIFNKFMIASNHVLVITRIFEPQFYRISSESMYAMYMTLDALNGFAFYNSDKKAGASQSHKHYQVIPYSSVDLPYLNLILKCVKTQIGQDLNFKERKVEQLKLDVFENYQYSLLKFQEFDSFTEDLLTYSQFLYKVLNYALEIVNNKNLDQSYNLILGKNYLCVVLRGNEHIEQSISINCLGVLGSMLVKDEQQKQLLQSKNTEELLDQILIKKTIQQQLIIQIQMLDIQQIIFSFLIFQMK